MKVVHAVGKRKSAIARAVIRDGKGRVYINKRSLEAYQPELGRLRISEALMLAPEVSEKVDIYVSVSGGGTMGQADAARTAIVRGLLEWSEDPKLREHFKEYDLAMIKSDVRYKLPKKAGGPGARARYQKSYR